MRPPAPIAKISIAAASTAAALAIGIPAATAAPATPVSTTVTPAAIVEICSASACLVSVTGAGWVDTDGDGVLDPDEKAFGSDPTIKASAPSAAVVFAKIRSDALPSFTAGHSFVVVLPTQLPSGPAIGGSAAPIGRQDALKSLGIDFRGVDLRFGVTVSRSSLANDPFGPQRRVLHGLSVADSESTAGGVTTIRFGKAADEWDLVMKGSGNTFDTIAHYRGQDPIWTLSGSKEQHENYVIVESDYTEYGFIGQESRTVNSYTSTYDPVPIADPAPGTRGTTQRIAADTFTENKETGTKTWEHSETTITRVTDAKGNTTVTTRTETETVTTYDNGEQVTTTSEKSTTKTLDKNGKYVSGDVDAGTGPFTAPDSPAQALARLTWNARYEPTEIRTIDQAWSPEVKRSMLILTDPTLADSVPGIPNAAMELPLVFFTKINPACQDEQHVCSDITDPSQLPPGPQPGQVPGIG